MSTKEKKSSEQLQKTEQVTYRIHNINPFIFYKF